MPEYFNQAAWLAAKSQPLTVSEAPVKEPAEGEILVRSGAVAINPFDGVVQALGSMITPWVFYPAILGSDVAGEVVDIGPMVTRFKKGDRVLGLALGIDKMSNKASEGAFQNYVILKEEAATVIPEQMTFEQAAVLPLAVATAACGLFLEDQLGLEPPFGTHASLKGQTVLIWGGSTSVGSCAVQLAANSGYDVIATASPKNFDYVRELGARLVFDYNDHDIVANVVKEMHGRNLVGALAITAGSGSACIDIVSQCQGRRIVSMASAPIALSDAPLAHQLGWRVSRIPQLALGFLALIIRARFKRVTTRSIWGTALVKKPLGRIIFSEFLGPALADGRFKAAPEPLVAGHSIGDIASAMAFLKKGVSARKVVVSL